MELSGAEITIKLLEMQGIRIIAGIPGGANLPLYDALYKSRIKHILVRHEQAAGFIAQGMARSTGKPAVCFATSGPGATNLMTAIADAKLDSIPIIAITGQVASSLIGTDAFQEVDTYGMALPITKHNFLVRNPRELLRIIPEAFKIATSERPGPVLIDIPKDVQQKKIECSNFKWPGSKDNKSHIGKSDITKLSRMINESERPLLYLGGGIINSDSSSLILKIAKKNSIPAACTLMGLGAFPPDDGLYLGMIGMHGARSTNMLLNMADLILAFGARFDDRATGDPKKFCSDAKIIHIDIDGSEINKIKKSHFHINADIKSVLEKIMPLIRRNRRAGWISEVKRIRTDFPFLVPPKKFHPLNILKKISGFIGRNAIITTDVGQHQMWTAQIFPIHRPRSFLTSGGLGTMGFGMPAAIGASLANPGKRVFCISGDGSFLMNVQEMATLADLGLDIKIIILNNGHLGLVRQQQEFFFSKNYIASKFDTNPDFASIARGFGIRGFDLKRKKNFDSELSRALNTKGPCIINIPINYSDNVLPMVPPGAGNLQAIGEWP